MSTGFDDRDDLLEAYLAKSGASDLGEDTPARLWEDGRQVGEWAVTGFLARGGSAEVYSPTGDAGSPESPLARGEWAACAIREGDALHDGESGAVVPGILWGGRG